MLAHPARFTPSMLLTSTSTHLGSSSDSEGAWEQIGTYWNSVTVKCCSVVSCLHDFFRAELKRHLRNFAEVLQTNLFITSLLVEGDVAVSIWSFTGSLLSL